MSDFSLMEKYEYLKDLVTSDRRESFLDLMKWIEENTAYLTAPASTKYHLSIEQGLLEHSVSVCTTMIKLKKLVAPEITDEQCVIVRLLHDLGKAGTDRGPQYIENEPTERQKQYGYKANPPYLYNKDLLWSEHEIRSLFLISNFGFKLKEEEFYAIAYHNEPWTEQKSAFRKNKVMTLLQNADYYSALYLEDKE